MTFFHFFILQFCSRVHGVRGRKRNNQPVDIAGKQTGATFKDKVCLLFVLLCFFTIYVSISYNYILVTGCGDELGDKSTAGEIRADADVDLCTRPCRVPGV